MSAGVAVQRVAVEKFGYSPTDLFGMRERQRMVGTFDDRRLGLGEPLRDDIPHLLEPDAAVRPANEKDGRSDPGNVVGIEIPVEESRKVCIEKRLGIALHLSRGACDDVVYVVAPTAAFHESHELLQRNSRTRLPAREDHALGGGAELRRARGVNWWGLDENESVHTLGPVRSHLQGDGSAVGQTNDVRSLYRQPIQELRTVRGVPDDGCGSLDRAARAVSPTVIEDPPESGHWGRARQWKQFVGDQRSLDENHRFAAAQLGHAQVPASNRDGPHEPLLFLFADDTPQPRAHLGRR